MKWGTWIRAILGGRLRRRHLESLCETVEAHLPVLPVVDAQLRDANREMEQAVSAVGASFGRIVRQAREGVNEASRLVGTGGEGTGGVEALLANSRGTLEGLLVRIERDAESCQKVVARMAAIEKDMGRIVKALEDVDRISFGNTILALNAKIEAAHMGERGQGFEIVAQELWSQARKSEEITEGIRGTVAALTEGAHAAAQEVGGMVCADRAQLSVVEREVRDALGLMERVHGDMRQSMESAGERSRALAEETSAAVQTMQFQDRVSQKIEHIVEALEAMQAAFTGELDPLGGGAGGGATSRAAELLAGSYTMNGERTVHAEAMGTEAGEGLELDDVEIF